MPLRNPLTQEEVEMATRGEAIVRYFSLEPAKPPSTPSPGLGSTKSLDSETLKCIVELLRIHINIQCQLDSERSPAEQFCCFQTGYAALALEQMIKKREITRDEIRLFIGNLIVMQRKIAINQPEVAQDCARMICELIDIIGELCNIIEKDNDLEVTNWTAVSTNISSNSVLAQEDQSAPKETLFIPSVSKFRRLRLLGVGDFGTVYRVSFQPYRLDCTMKIVRKDVLHANLAFVDKLVASVVNSPFIVRHHACFMTDDFYIAIMEYVHGVEALNIIDKYEGMPSEHVKSLTAQLILAVEHMHVRGIIHRDIKPSNMLVLQNGQMKLTDFNSAKICVGNFLPVGFPFFKRRTAYEYDDKESVGTKAYLAPEVMRGPGYGRSSDWWSVGVTMYKMIIGGVPFHGNTYQELLDRILYDDHHWRLLRHAIYQIMPEACNVTFRFLKKLPENRLGSSSYQDIRSCEYFRDVKWNEVWKKVTHFESRALVYGLSKLERPEQVTTSNLLTVPMMPHEQSGKPIEFRDLHDGSPNCQMPLFTYTSKLFKKLMSEEVVPQGDLRDVLGTRTPPSDIVHFDGLVDPDRYLDQTPSLHYRRRASSVTNEIITDIKLSRGRTFGVYGSYGFEIDKVTSEGGVPYCFVTNVKNGSPAANAGLVYGDIITAYNGVNVGTSKPNIPRAGELTVSVFTQNPFRLVNTRGLSQKVSNTPRITFEINNIGKVKHFNALGFKTHECGMWDEFTERFTTIHIVSRVHPQLMSSPRGPPLFVGDIVAAIQNQGLLGLKAGDAENILNTIQDPVVSVTVVPLSPLRSQIDAPVY